ncbi:hypothetical protein C8R43DRAFT_1167387 [Mycena crocata]|nr:hypothetical protein C8R43DRAFT_1167387 [Mycena crocata]
MVFGFFRHVAGYFTGQNASREPDRAATYAPAQPAPNHLNMIPCYNDNGEIIAYRLSNAYGQTNINPSTNNQSAPMLNISQSNITSPAQPIEQGGPSSGVTPSTWGTAQVASMHHQIRKTHRRDSDVSMRSAPVLPRSRAASISSSSSTNDAPPNPDKKPKVEVEWDPWPNGDFERDFTWAEFHAADALPVHWACESIGGDQRGSDTADEWPRGKKTRRRCRGIIHCDNESCGIIVRPQTRTKGIQKQLLQDCRCGKRLRHIDCGIQSTLYSFADGVHYVNGGTHHHPRPTHILHMTTGEREKFTKIIHDYPKVGPLSLLVGRPGLHGPQESVAEISSVLLNKDRVKSERRRAKQQGDLPHSDFAEYAQFEKENPDFIIYSQFGANTVVVMQTPFMLAQLVKTQVILRDAINGIVSDGAHSYFIDRNALLLMSSAYCLDIDGWVPGIMSYTNGATQDHFFVHFFCLFETIAGYAEKQGIEIRDSLFKNVVDFSDAERLGFVEAFVAFWRRRNDPRSDEELRKAGSALLKGCRQHSRAQVDRVKKISAVVHPSLRDVFVNQAMALLDVEDYTEFMQKLELLVRNFPKAEGWVRWWARECHAKMLFKPFREMHIQDWNSMPDTTNPQESQHFKIYSAIGKKHELIPGLKGLLHLVQYYARIATAANSGIKIRYGAAEDWKHPLKNRSRDHNKSRRTYRKDGRPPDTSQDLLGKSSKGQSETPPNTPPPTPPASGPLPRRLPSYPWHKNSCYLDTSLELIFRAVSRGFHVDFSPRAAALIESDAIKQLFDHMAFRKALEEDSSSELTAIRELAEHKEYFRNHLRRTRIIPDPYTYKPLFGWLETIISHRHDPQPNYAQSYFQAHDIRFRSCPGDEQTPRHFQLQCLRSRSYFNLFADTYESYDGDVAKWFRERVKINKRPEESPSCWRNIDNDGARTCDGAATVHDIFLGIPVVLIFEMPSTGRGRTPQWNFPKHIRPLTREAETKHGLIYDIVGRAWTNDGHFRCTFTPDMKQVYDYDDMQNQGYSINNRGAKLSALLGKIEPESGWRTFAVVYHLRGGTRAQSFFAKSQVETAQLPDVVGLNLPNINKMDAKDRFWLGRSAQRTDWIDFVSSQPPLSNPKRVRFMVDDSEDDVSDETRPTKRSRRSTAIVVDDSDDEKDLQRKPLCTGVGVENKVIRQTIQMLLSRHGSHAQCAKFGPMLHVNGMPELLHHGRQRPSNVMTASP